MGLAFTRCGSSLIYITKRLANMIREWRQAIDL